MHSTHICLVLFVGLLATTGSLADFTSVSTVPANGDVNPYGVFIVPESKGKLKEGHILVSNFNNAANQQGTGTTIVDVSPNGVVNLFVQVNAATVGPQCNGGVGLTTALVVLKRGWVIVGSLPTADGTTATATPGCLIVVDCNGNVVTTFTSPLINGPWDMTVADFGHEAVLFVTNVLNGDVAHDANMNPVNKGTVLRIVLDVPECCQAPQQYPRIKSEKIIGSGFGEKADPDALIIGPTGVALDCEGTLFVADTLYNRISAIPEALTRPNTAFTGEDVTANNLINQPLGMAFAGGLIWTTNAQNGNLVTTNPDGVQTGFITLVPGGADAAGSLFGLALRDNSTVYWVNDADNTLNQLNL